MLEDRKDVKYKFATFDINAYPSVIDSFGKNYPELIYGNITSEEMTKKMDEAQGVHNNEK